jgi:pyruvate/2-oxoacid:ferredoxin oxidoreductase alpha subunit
MNADGASVAAFVPRILAPLPLEPLQDFLFRCDRVVVVETSYAAQFHRYLRSLVDLPPDTRVLARSGGKNLSVAEIIEAVGTREEVMA